MSQEFVYSAVARRNLRPADLIFRRRVGKSAAKQRFKDSSEEKRDGSDLLLDESTFATMQKVAPRGHIDERA
ncbi:MAG: hypothetical protein IJ228_12290 [Succinivibrio sp.]|nr:hypothetical protein [Succinivibrio sp.]